MFSNGPEAMRALDNNVEILGPGGEVLATFAGPKEEVAAGILSVIQRELVSAERGARSS
jgi:hypothetical protein